MLAPNMLIYFGISAGLLNFMELKGRKKTPALTSSGKQKLHMFGFLRKGKHDKPLSPTFFGNRVEEGIKPVEDALASKDVGSPVYEPSKYDISDEEPLFSKEELDKIKQEEIDE